MQEYINEIWPKLHELAEPAFEEFNTSAFIAENLRAMGYEVHTGIGGTGVVGILDSGKPGLTVALRSDMDCLTFKQTDGSLKRIHACGHDGHMTIALGVAKMFAEKGVECGKIKFLFQPAEEIGKGALAMLKDGALDDVDCVIGYHLMPRSMVRRGQIISQLNWTACTLIEGEIKGLAAHGSQPHLGINAIDIGAAIVNAINALHTNPLLSGNVKTTRFLGGSGSLNAICDKVNIGFDLRSTSNGEMLELRERVMNTVKNIARAYGAEADCHIVGTCPAAEADPSLLKLTQDAIVEVLGVEGLVPSHSVTIGEDFNFFKQERPQIKTASLGIGCDLEPGLHDPEMHYELTALEDGMKVLFKLMNKVACL